MPAPALPTERVEVSGGGARELQRASVGAMVVVGRDELLRHGDARLADALKRLPGVTVLGSGPRGPELRLSGLGGGYTQLLLNGEPVPPGFSLETLSPELVERVEVSRSASVEQSNQAIAGSLNIVLRRVASSARREAKGSVGQQFGRPLATADLSWGDKAEALAWSVGLGAQADKQVWPMQLSQRTVNAAGQVTQAYVTDKQEFGRNESLSLSPRATWTLSPQQSLATEHLLRVSRWPGAALDRRSSSVGERPEFARNDLWIKPWAWQWRGRLNWSLTEADQTRWELKLGYTRNRRSSVAEFDGYDFDGRWIRDARVDSLADDQAWNLSGRWRRPVGEAHALALGWDADQTRRSEDRLQREQPLPGGLPVENLDEVYDAQVRRLAFFAQDEWTISPQWSATLGLRWEGLHTRSSGNVFDSVRQRSGVLSPVLQALWKPAGSKDQLRLSLARSYKAPTPRELTPRRYVANNNSPTTPDLQGNPALRPELAWSLDAGWDHPLAGGGSLGLNAFVKRIEDVAVDELLQQDGAWVMRRTNLGLAWVQGLGLEARWPQKSLWPAGPALEWRANLAWNRSRVAAVPGPDNRLAQQVPLSLQLGVDHRLVSAPLSWGASFGYTDGAALRLAANRWAVTPTGRSLDAYLSWKPASGPQWRLSASNLLQTDEVKLSRVQVNGQTHSLRELLRTGWGLRLAAETNW